MEAARARKSVREEWQECLKMIFSNMSKVAKEKGYHQSWVTSERDFYGPHGEIVFLKMVDDKFRVTRAFIAFMFKEHKPSFSYSVSFDGYIIPFATVFPRRGEELPCHVITSPVRWVYELEEGRVPEPTTYTLPRGNEQEIIDLFTCFLNLLEEGRIERIWDGKDIWVFPCPDIGVEITFCASLDVIFCGEHLRTITRYVFCPVMFYEGAYARVLLRDLIKFVR